MNRSYWLVSARFDLAVFVAPALLSLLVAAGSGVLAGPQAQTPTWAWLLLVVGIDVAHVHGTTLRVYLNAGERRRRAWLYRLVPAGAFGVSVLAYAYSAGLFWSLLAYLAVVHFVRQQIGWARLYRRRAGETSRLDARLDELTLYAAMIYPLIVWHTRLPVAFAWIIGDDFLPGLPPLAADLAMPLWAALLLAFATRQLQLRSRGVPFRVGKICLVATTAATWWLGIVYVADDFAFTVTNVVAHGVPYMAMSQRVDKRSYRSPLLYVMALCALAFTEEWLWDVSVWHEHDTLFPAPAWDLEFAWGLLVPLLALPQIVHYVLDAYLWRLDGSNPGLAQVLLPRSDATSARSEH